MPRQGLAAPVVGAAALTVLLTGCAGADDERRAAGARAEIAVDARDDGCALSRAEVPAGPVHLAVTNHGGKVTEVYVYRVDGSIVSERENIGPGTRAQLTVELTAGRYEVACKPGMVGKGIRTRLTVGAGDGETGSGSGATPTPDPAAVSAVAAYRAWVQQQADALVPATEAFADAVAAGDVARAKQLYAPSRVAWERIEPVAESFGDLDPKVDAREGDVPAAEWGGWHRIEQALWVRGSAAGLAPVARHLVADVTELQRRVAAAPMTVTSIANGAKELLDEVATGKVTGEEERYSHTDLVDFAANVAGARKAFDVLRPIVRDVALVRTLDTRFGAVEQALAAHRTGPGEVAFVSYAALSREQVRALAAAVNALAEPLSRLAAAVVAPAGSRS